MPELPDVQVYKETIDATSLHSRIETVHVPSNGLLDVSERTLRRHLRGRALEGTRRHGKWLFVACGDGWLRLHFGMTGLPVYRKGGEPPEFAKLALDFEDGGTLHIVSRRKLGHIGWIDDPDRFIEAERLGPDPVATDGFGLEAFRERLEERRGMIKTTLMNQQVIAGLGNVYSDEILFQGGLDPEAQAASLRSRTVGTLHRTLQRVLHKAIEARAEPDEMPRSWLLPSREDGADCPRCGGTVRRKQVAGRSTYWCPSHQRARS